MERQGNKKLKVLVAEDEKALAGAMRLKLEHEGIAAAVAQNGQEALEILQKEKFDLMVLDLVMPKIDGFEVLEKLQAMGNRMPVVVASNLGQEADVARAKELGAIDFFIKSNTPVAELVKKIKTLLAV